MPELPEVETIRRDLSEVLVGKRIKKVEVRKHKIVRGAPATFVKRLTGARVGEINRRGKLLVFTLRKRHQTDSYMLVHLKMTGQLICQDARQLVAGGHPFPWTDELPNKYSHVIISFTDGSRLYFNDLRQFGFMRAVGDKELKRVLAAYGVEPLSDDFTVELLRDVLKGRKTALKNVLLDQRRIAGLGNIYVDEASFVAKVRPTRRADRLTQVEVKRLHWAIRQVLRKAVAERGTTFGMYRDGRGAKGNYVRLLKVYGRAGKRCLRCKEGVIAKTKVNGRGTAYCPVCQA